MSSQHTHRYRHLLFLLAILCTICTADASVGWRLYESNRVPGKPVYDCLYFYWSEETTESFAPRDLVPYCIRTQNEGQWLSDDDMLNGSLSNAVRKYTFLELRNNNVTVEYLFDQNAPIDVIEKYDIYLEYDDANLSTMNFYECRSGWFGHYCQYTFDSFESFTEIVMQRFDMKYDIYMNPTRAIDVVKNGTCYTHLQCSYIVPSLCLDWREICDG